MLIVCISPVLQSQIIALPIITPVADGKESAAGPAVCSLGAPVGLPSPVDSLGGVYPIRGDSFCGYHCVGAIDALLQDPRALDSGFECSYDVLAVTRKRILDAFGEWWAAKRDFYTSDVEMEEEEVAARVVSSQSLRDRVSGRKGGRFTSVVLRPCLTCAQDGRAYSVVGRSASNFRHDRRVGRNQGLCRVVFRSSR